LKDFLGSLGRNKGLKILSLLLALSLWFAVGTEEPTETTLAVPLEMVNLPHGMMIISEIPPAVQVRVIGPGSVIRKLTQTRLAQTIDLTGFKRGRHFISLTPKSFNFPRGVQIIRVQPNPLYVTLAITLVRTIHIDPVLEGHPPEGYEIVSVKARPSQVGIKGPHAEIADLKVLPTMPLDVSQVTAPITLAAEPDFKNLHLTLINQTPILVDVNVAPKIITRTLPGVVVAATPQKARLRVSHVTVTLKGPMLQVKALKAGDLKATVDTTDLSHGRHQLEVSVSLPPDVTLVKVQPATISAWIAKSP
jgi:YbbR domain-containing protein